ncbi:hypothetical protein [Streptococcus salivarius]
MVRRNILPLELVKRLRKPKQRHFDKTTGEHTKYDLKKTHIVANVKKLQDEFKIIGIMGMIGANLMDDAQGKRYFGIIYNASIAIRDVLQGAEPKDAVQKFVDECIKDEPAEDEKRAGVDHCD